MNQDEKNTHQSSERWDLRINDLSTERDFLARRVEYDTQRLQAVDELIRLVESRQGKTDDKK